MEKVEKTLLMFEGSYEYLKDNIAYSEEEFVVFKSNENKSITYRSEQLTRVGTGEFLKVNTEFVVNLKYIPYDVTVIKSLGMDISTERYLINHEKNLMTYIFSSENTSDEDSYTEKELEINVPNKFHLVTTAFVSSVIFTFAQKFSAMGRNPFIMLKSNSDWEFNQKIDDTPVYIELLSHEKTELKLNDQDLTCTKINIYQNDSSSKPEKPTVFYLSRHIGIPYKLTTEDGIQICIKKLKKHDNIYDKMY